jgi:hypothetical protein
MKRETSVTFILVILTLSAVSPLLAVTNSVTTNPSQGMFPSTTFAARILIDESHSDGNSELWTPGNATKFGSFLMDYGHHVDTNFDADFDSGILDTYDILVIFFPQIALTSAEVQAVEDFVDNGGHLLLVGIDNRPGVGDYTSQELNAVSENYGITFNEDALLGRAVGTDDELSTHHLTQDVDSISTKAGNFLQGCSLTVSSPATSIVTVKDLDFVAVAEVGASKIVAVGGAAPFLALWDNGDASWQISPDDHLQFVLNIVDWMTDETERTVVVPEESIMTVGAGPDLNESEIAEYEMFTGIIHDHTTYSDGDNTAEDMTLAAVEAQLDFMVMADHSWENPGQTGIYGALACRDVATRYGLDILIGIGAELSNGQHVVGFPLTENVWSGDMQEKVDGIQNQGGIAILAHPLLGQGYQEPWENYDTYGYDAFEVVNTDWAHGEGDAAYFRPFVAASDGHSSSFVGTTSNVIFVENPSGPNGTLAIEDVADAVLNRRLVAICKSMGFILGEEVWVNRYLEMREEAELEIEAAEEEITTAISGGADAILSSIYLDEAQTALDFMNTRRAIQHATSALELVDLDIIIDASDLDGATPESSADIIFTLENDLDHDVIFNITPFLYTALSFDTQSIVIDATAETTEEHTLSCTTAVLGYTRIYLNIEDLTPATSNRPVVVALGGIIENVSSEVVQEEGGLHLVIDLLKNDLDSRYLTSVEIEYGTGSSTTSSEMTNLGNRYSITIGPFETATNVTYSILVYDNLGNSYTISERTVEISSPAVGLDGVNLILVGGVAIGIVALVIVVMKIRK